MQITKSKDFNKSMLDVSKTVVFIINKKEVHL